MFNPYLNQQLNQNTNQPQQQQQTPQQRQDEIDMREFITTNHYKNHVAPILERELRAYQSHKYGQGTNQTQIPQPPKDYKK